MKKLTGAEYQLMNIIWNQKKELTTAEIIDHAQREMNWTRGAIGSYLSKLVQKKLLTSIRKGKTYLYSPVEKKEYEQFVINETLYGNFGKDMAQLVVAFAGKEESQENLELVRNLIERLENE